jgi:hypothetical protein
VSEEPTPETGATVSHFSQGRYVILKTWSITGGARKFSSHKSSQREANGHPQRLDHAKSLAGYGRGRKQRSGSEMEPEIEVEMQYKTSTCYQFGLFQYSWETIEGLWQIILRTKTSSTPPQNEQRFNGTIQCRLTIVHSLVNYFMPPDKAP